MVSGSAGGEAGPESASIFPASAFLWENVVVSFGIACFAQAWGVSMGEMSPYLRRSEPVMQSQPQNAEQIADALKEEEGQAREKIAAIVERCGLDFAQDIFEQTLAVEEQGGLMVRDGSRRRTVGGVFFYLVKDRLKREKRYSDLDDLFPRDERSPAGPVSPHAPPIPQRVRPRPRPVREAGAMPDNTSPARKPSGTSRTPYNRPDQTTILDIIEQHIGNPPDLYRRSIAPDTGEVTLSFHFPDVASVRYGEKLAAASASAGVVITINPQPNQQALIDLAGSLLPQSLALKHHPSIFADRKTVRVFCVGEQDETSIQQARNRFTEMTGWQLDIVFAPEQTGEMGTIASSSSDATPMSQHQAIQTARQQLGEDCYKVGAREEIHTLTVHFYFPQVMQQRYAHLLADIEARTRWHLTVHQAPHQGKLIETARQTLLPLLTIAGSPSLYQQEQRVVVRTQDRPDPQAVAQACEQFQATTGWSLAVVPEPPRE
jgi:hypothetical protein